MREFRKFTCTLTYICENLKMIVMHKDLSRRNFIRKSSVLGAGLLVGIPSYQQTVNNKPVLLGGGKIFNGQWPSWPIFSNIEETRLMGVLRSKQWGRLARNTATAEFEKEYQNITGAKHALATTSGTAALFAMLGALEIGPGDEVIIPPYTFIATYNVIGLHYALPIFVDTDIESFQIDASKIEKAITKETKALLPVHIGGSPFDVDAVLKIGKKHNIPVLEDACQAHLGEWKGKCLGNWGLGGAFSFQASKNLNAGEGGAVITNDADYYQKCYGFHHQGQTANSASLATGAGTRGSNLRITEFQSAILLAQMTRLKEQAETRWQNANYLTKLLKTIPGISPAKLYNGTTKSAHHLYMFRYNKNNFNGLSRDNFIKALNAEGITSGAGYGMINKGSYVTNLAKEKHYLKIYGEKRMKEWLDQTINCPVNDRLTTEAVWFFQNMLLGTRQQMEQIADAVKRIQKNAPALVKQMK